MAQGFFNRHVCLIQEGLEPPEEPTDSPTFAHIEVSMPPSADIDVQIGRAASIGSSVAQRTGDVALMGQVA